MVHLQTIRRNTEQINRLLDILEKTPKNSSMPTDTKIRFAKEKMLKLLFDNEKMLKRMIK